MASFLVIFALFQVYFCLAFYAAGATFDDGGNHNPDKDDGYDTKHNDFPNIGTFWVYLFQVLRTSMGDFQPPSYDYWVARYDEGQIGWAYTNIAVIWLLWFGQIMLVVICMLNFLIAIVSDSYAWIIEN